MVPAATRLGEAHSTRPDSNTPSSDPRGSPPSSPPARPTSSQVSSGPEELPPSPGESSSARPTGNRKTLQGPENHQEHGRVGGAEGKGQTWPGCPLEGRELTGGGASRQVQSSPAGCLPTLPQRPPQGTAWYRWACVYLCPSCKAETSPPVLLYPGMAHSKLGGNEQI